MICQRLSVLAIGLILLGAFAGCRERKVSSRDSTGSAGSQEANAEDLLKSAIHQLHPENYSIAAADDKPINLLNSWRVVMAPTAPTELSSVPAGWIAQADAERLKAANYELRDAVHIRDAMMNHAIATYLVARATDEVAQSQAIFDYVVRNITLRNEDEADLPLSVYSLLMVGRGTPEDRAWVCAALLKQLRIDSVIIRPSGDAAADAEAWLLGILLNGHVYLFDPRLGIALPSSSDLQAAGPPATLAEISSHPDWLKSLAIRADQPYPIDAEMLKQPAIQPIVESDFWSQRMRHLESVLPAADVCVLYDPLVDESGRAGLLSRLQKGGAAWKLDQMKAWNYPQVRSLQLLEIIDLFWRQTIAMGEGKADAKGDPNRPENPVLQTLSPPAKQALVLATQPFNLPIQVVVNPLTKTESPHPERKMLRIRSDQLLGKFEDSTRLYLTIRQLEIDSTRPELAVLNKLGAENAIYWTAVCKFEAREYEAAIEQLSTYLKRYDRNGRWNFAARALLAECHAELGQFKEAAAVLERFRQDDPYRAANAIRVKRWKALQ